MLLTRLRSFFGFSPCFFMVYSRNRFGVPAIFMPKTVLPRIMDHLNRSMVIFSRDIRIAPSVAVMAANILLFTGEALFSM